MAIRYGDDIIVVDAGMMFPDAELLGVDIVTPDFAYLEQNRENVRALILTHGHEDHIGAVPFLLSEINIPVYGAAFTLALVERRLEEHGLLDERQAAHGEARRQGRDRAVHRSSSFTSRTPSSASMALAITTPLGVIIHTGDFKVDPTPTDNELFDLHTFADYGKRGVLLLMSDSTNVDRPGYTESERARAPALGRHLLSRRAAAGHLLLQLVDPSAAADSGSGRRVRPQGGVPGPQHAERHRDRALAGPAEPARRNSAASAGHHADRSEQGGGGGFGHAGRADVGAVAHRGGQSQEPVGGARRHGGAERAHHSRATKRASTG